MAISDVQAKIAEANTAASALVDRARNYVGLSADTNELLSKAEERDANLLTSAQQVVPTSKEGQPVFGHCPTAPAPTIMSDFQNGVYYKGLGSSKKVMSADQMWTWVNNVEAFVTQADGTIKQVSKVSNSIEYPWGGEKALGLISRPYLRSLCAAFPDINNSTWSKDNNAGASTEDTNVPAQTEGRFLYKVREGTGDKYRGVRANSAYTVARTYLSVGFTVDFRNQDRGVRVYVTGWGDKSMGEGITLYHNSVSASLTDTLIRYKATYLGGTRYRIEFSLGVPSTGNNKPTVYFRMLNVTAGTVTYQGDGSSAIWLGDISVVAGALNSHSLYNDDGSSFALSDIVQMDLKEGDIGSQDIITMYAEGEQNSTNGCFAYIHGDQGLNEHIRFGPATNNTRALYLQSVDMGNPNSVPALEFLANPRHSLCKMMVTVTRGGEVKVAMNGEAVRTSAIGSSYTFNKLKLGGVSPNNNNLAGNVGKFMLWSNWTPSNQEMLDMTRID